MYLIGQPVLDCVKSIDDVRQMNIHFFCSKRGITRFNRLKDSTVFPLGIYIIGSSNIVRDLGVLNGLYDLHGLYNDGVAAVFGNHDMKIDVMISELLRAVLSKGFQLGYLFFEREQTAFGNPGGAEPGGLCLKSDAIFITSKTEFS